MFNVVKILREHANFIHSTLQRRQKTKIHWAKLKKKTGPKYKALNHFDDFYGSVFGKQWPPMREAMLRKQKYVVVINNYGDIDDTIENLKNKGAHSLKELMNVQKQFNKEYTSTSVTPVETVTDNKIEEFAAKFENDSISSLYPKGTEPPDKLETQHSQTENKDINKEKEEKKKVYNLDESLSAAQYDESRIIHPNMGVATEALHQYIPATQLKGMEDFVLESTQFSNYMNSKEKDFPLMIEAETEFIFPEHLKVYTYEKGSEWSTFPEPKRTKTGVFNYYPMDSASVIAALALQLEHGDRVLDLCAAPGGKSVIALQTLLPDVIVCNDTSISRSNRMHRIFRDYLVDFESSNKWRERVVFTRYDGRAFTDDQGFDKILVDVPCTTDRHSLVEDENNIFRPDRVRERLKLPDLQSQILANALKLAKVGGAVVYSTCSLSPVQNDGVVHMALKTAFETHGIVFVVRDMTSCMEALSATLDYGVGATKPKYGQLITPSVDANFGPMYFARLVRVK